MTAVLNLSNIVRIGGAALSSWDWCFRSSCDIASRLSGQSADRLDIRSGQVLWLVTTYGLITAGLSGDATDCVMWVTWAIRRPTQLNSAKLSIDRISVARRFMFSEWEIIICTLCYFMRVHKGRKSFLVRIRHNIWNYCTKWFDPHLFAYLVIENGSLRTGVKSMVACETMSLFTSFRQKLHRNLQMPNFPAVCISI